MDELCAWEIFLSNLFFNDSSKTQPALPLVPRLFRLRPVFRQDPSLKTEFGFHLVFPDVQGVDQYEQAWDKNQNLKDQVPEGVDDRPNFLAVVFTGQQDVKEEWVHGLFLD